MDISVIVPTFRRPELLAEAIRSALEQERVSMEVIVVDDSPEGSARDVVAGFAVAFVTYIKSELPSGGKPASVRNAGWPRAQGRFIHFLDDDDLAISGFYRAAVDAFEAHPERGVVFGGIVPIGTDPAALAHERVYFAQAMRRARIASTMRSRLWFTASLLFENTMLVNSACMIRRECVAQIGGYDSAVPMNEDVDFYSRAIRRFGCVFLDQPVLQYRILNDSLMHGRKEDTPINEAYKRIYANYTEAHSATELFLMKVFARTVLRML